MKKRAFSLLLALLLVVGLFPVTANANELGNGIEYEVFHDYVAITNYYGEAAQLTIPDKIEGLPVTVIDAYAFFYSEELVGITIPNTVTRIGNHAFAYCEKLESIDIPDKVTTIEAGTFQSCTNLKKVDLPSNLTSIENSAFDSCAKLTNITLPAGIISVGFNAFCNCDSLTGISFPANIQEIGSFAFYDCDSLANVTIPSGVLELSSYTFAHCDRMTAIQVNAGNPEYCSKDGALYTKDMTRLVCCPGGKQGSFTVPASVTYLDDAFVYCSKLTHILVESGNQSFCSMDGILYSDDMAELVRCPSGRQGALVVPETVSELWYSCFEECTKLTSIQLPSTLTEIHPYAFNLCTNLRSITIPANVTQISYDAFYDSGLNAICFEGDAPEFDEYTFETITATAYYPAGNPTWTADAMQNYDGSITWIGYNPEGSFYDVQMGSWYEAPVEWAVSKGITNGATADTFNPNGQCLRAQVVTFLYRAKGNPSIGSASNPFTDVKSSDFFYNPVLWAVRNGITNGVSATKFGSYDVCNRAAVVTFLWRAAGKPEPKSTVNPFKDVKTSDFFYKPVLWAIENNITNGIDATHFGPTAACNRAQVVTFLYRAYN